MAAGRRLTGRDARTKLRSSQLDAAFMSFAHAARRRYAAEQLDVVDPQAHPRGARGDARADRHALHDEFRSTSIARANPGQWRLPTRPGLERAPCARRPGAAPCCACSDARRQPVMARQAPALQGRRQHDRPLQRASALVGSGYAGSPGAERFHALFAGASWCSTSGSRCRPAPATAAATSWSVVKQPLAAPRDFPPAQPEPRAQRERHSATATPTRVPSTARCGRLRVLSERARDRRLQPAGCSRLARALRPLEEAREFTAAPRARRLPASPPSPTSATTCAKSSRVRWPTDNPAGNHKNMSKKISLTRYLIEQQREHGTIPIRAAPVDRDCRRLPAHRHQRQQRAHWARWLGSAESENVQGEVQKKLDIISNEVPIDANELVAIGRDGLRGNGDHPCRSPTAIPRANTADVRTRLTGSNIDVNVSGSGPSSRCSRSPTTSPIAIEPVRRSRLCRASSQQVAAGYRPTARRPQLVLTVGNGVIHVHARPRTGRLIRPPTRSASPRTPRNSAINMSNMRH